MAIIMSHSAMIHVPKTGESWCREAIRRTGIPHFESIGERPGRPTIKHASLASPM